VTVDSSDRPFFATAAKGTEGALRDELRDLRIPRIRADRGGVHFGGDFEHGMRACLRSRIALRVLWRVATFTAADADTLYEGAGTVDWSRFLDPQRTLAVSATVKHGALRHTGFVAQRIKDAVVDQLRGRTAARPDVDRHDPDVHVVAHVARDEAQLFVDLAGAPLSRRGYRADGGEAPLREHLAAAMLRRGGWRPGAPFADPMCGSGTLPIEAALWAASLPSGGRRHFGFERWRCFDDEAVAAWAREREHAQTFDEPVESLVEGSDRDPNALALARANARRAGVTIRLGRRDFGDIRPLPAGSFVMTNPPYGVRVDQDARWIPELRRALDVLRDATVIVITPDRELPRAVGRAADREHTLFNGDLECRLFTWGPNRGTGPTGGGP
jgi:putative N6-adenine-specific DNA methylase